MRLRAGGETASFIRSRNERSAGSAIPKSRFSTCGAGRIAASGDCSDNSELPRLAYRSLMLAEERDEIDRGSQIGKTDRAGQIG